MTETAIKTRWHPTRTNLFAGGLVAAGLLLTNTSWWFLLLTAAGAFGPGVLRELGWLRDKDEFQRLAAYRAGYHAYVTSGLVAFFLVAFFRSSETTIDYPQELATLFLALLWFTWFLSSLIAYWGPQRAAARILSSFGCVWFVFAVVSNIGAEWTGWAALLLHPLLAAPFFALAWLSGRWPRVTGVLLLAVSGFFVQFFGMFRQDHLAIVNQAVTFVLFIGPLVGSGIALVAAGAGQAEDDDETETKKKPAQKG